MCLLTFYHLGKVRSCSVERGRPLLLFRLNGVLLECFSTGHTRLFRSIHVMVLIAKQSSNSWGRLGIHFRWGFLPLCPSGRGRMELFGFLPYLEGTPPLGLSPEIGLELCCLSLANIRDHLGPGMWPYPQPGPISCLSGTTGRQYSTVWTRFKSWFLCFIALGLGAVLTFLNHHFLFCKRKTSHIRMLSRGDRWETCMSRAGHYTWHR